MASEVELRTAAWYGDQLLRLDFPAEWDVAVLWPRTPPPLADDEICALLERPIGQAPIRQICRGKRRPLVIVDDLNRPTPAARVMPFLLRHFQDAGIAAGDVRILMASGTHGAPRPDALRKKVGAEAASSCQLLVHDNTRHLARLGRTSFGTQVLVNKEVVSSDFVVGIGGIYPNNTAGFGGGSKLALGVLGFGSILQLHFSHRSMGWGSSEESDFRKDLDEVARMIGVNTTISLHVGANREIIRLHSGDHLLYHKEAVAFSKKAFGMPIPEDVNVVISNAYPNDLSLTFVRMKGIKPLERCAPQVSRIAIASCSEGLGRHGIFPFMNAPRFHHARIKARLILMKRPGEAIGKIPAFLYKRLRAKFMPNGKSGRGGESPTPKNFIWLYRPENHSEPLPSQIPGIRVSSSWPEIVQAVRKEQGGWEHLRVLVYPCAPLQCLDPAISPPGEALATHVGLFETKEPQRQSHETEEIQKRW